MTLQRLTRRGAIVAGAAAASAGALGAGVAATAAGKPTKPTRLYLLGDSWAAGLFADPDRALGQVAARRLGLTPVVDAVSGTGYLTATGSGGTYAARALHLARRHDVAVAVVQGGSNDGTARLASLPAATARTIARLRHRLPGAHLLLLGPGPDPEPVDARQRHVDALLAKAAEHAGVPYVSIFERHWIHAATADRVLDPTNNHPTVAGQAYLGRRLAHVIRGFFPDLRP